MLHDHNFKSCMTKHCLTTETQHPLQRCANVEIAVRLHMEPGTRDRRPSPNRNGNSRSPPVSIMEPGTRFRRHYNMEIRDLKIAAGIAVHLISNLDLEVAISIGSQEFEITVRLHLEPGFRDRHPSPCGTRHSRSPSVSILTRDLRIAVRLHLEPGTVRLHTTARPYGTRKSRSPSVSTWNPELRDRRPSAIWNPWVHPKSLTGCIPHRQSCMDPECFT